MEGEGSATDSPPASWRTVPLQDDSLDGSEDDRSLSGSYYSISLYRLSDSPAVASTVASNGRCLAETQISEDELPATAESNTSCGLGSWRPAWVQRLASKKTFTLLHGLIGLHQFAVGSYMIATFSTVEKRFKIPSKTTGVIAAAWEVGGCFSLLFMGYLGRHGHKPRLVAAGMFLMAVACFGRLLPHFIYGPGQDALGLTEEFGDDAVLIGNHTGNVSSEDRGSLCSGARFRGDEDCSDGGSLGPPSIIFFISNVIFGISGSMYWTLGVAYLDDNTHKDKAPLTLAATTCIRLLGPTLGFSLASYALARYVDLDVTPLIDKADPRWIGAWWMGYAPSAAVAVLLGLLMLLFPRQLPRAAARRALRLQDAAAAAAAAPATQRGMRDFGLSIKRMFQNRILFFNTLSGVCYVFGLIGYWTFMPKYMETQYRKSASTASLISGSVGIVFSGVGIAASALVMHKWKPRARALAAWSVAVEAVDVLGHVSWAFLSCGEQDLHGSAAADGAWNLTATCNVACACGPDVKYEPVCSLAAATTFYSPCHAGCASARALLNATMTFSDCACSPDGLVVEGACARDCSFNFVVFLAMQSFMHLLGSSGKAGNTLIQFRCVNEEDKSLAIAFGDFMIALLAFMPGPIVYGTILDSACLVWGTMCGKTGNCWLYDDKKLRYVLNFTAGACMLCGTLLDIVVWYYCKDLMIYEEDGKKQVKLSELKQDEEEVLLQNTNPSP